MSFDPALPVNNSPVTATELRAQFNALKALNDGLAATVAPQAVQIASLTTEMSLRMRTSDAMAVFAANVNGVAADATAFDDPPTQGQVESLRDKLNELIAALQSI